MRSDVEPRPRVRLTLEAWNRKLHYYLGLYLVFFLWLFSATGLLLNHPRWTLSRIPNDANPEYTRHIEPPAGTTDVTRARDVLRQLKLTGEIEWPQAQPPGRLDFNVAYPKRAAQIRVDLARNVVTVEQYDRSFWSALRISHTFSGSRYTTSENRRDWILTSLWVIAMDAVAIGLLVMVLGSYYMWYRLKSKHGLGYAVLAFGYLTAAMFVFGLLPE